MRMRRRTYVDLTHVGRHVTGLERIAIELFAKAHFEGVEIVPVRAGGVASMIFKQQIVLPLLALLNPRSAFVFPGFPPSPFFALCSRRAHMYVHDLFLLTRRDDLSRKARLYMAPQFAFAIRHLTRFFTNSETTARDLGQFARDDATITLYRPKVENHFQLDAMSREHLTGAAPFRFVSLGTVEPRKNYEAAVRILDALRARHDAQAELHIIGRPGWGASGQAIANHTGVIVHGYLEAAAAKAIIEQADVYLCTSHDEGLGLPLIEAQYAGLPVIAPDKPVFREVLGSSGTFIAPDDANAAADIIAAIGKQPKSHAAAAIANVTRWNDAAAADYARAATELARAGEPENSNTATAKCV